MYVALSAEWLCSELGVCVVCVRGMWASGIGRASCDTVVCTATKIKCIFTSKTRTCLHRHAASDRVMEKVRRTPVVLGREIPGNKGLGTPPRPHLP